MPVNPASRAGGSSPAGPVYVTFGQGPTLAVVMAPVMPCWDEGAFFAPLTERLVALGYRVMIFDSLSLQPAPADLQDLARAWRQILQGLGPVHLLAGSALGGALVQRLLDTRWAAQIPLTLLISAPTEADVQLDQRLGQMAHLAGAGELAEALRWLDYWVAPEAANPVVGGLAPKTSTLVVRGLAPERPVLLTQECQPGPLGSKPPHHRANGDTERACARLALGFALLQGLDVRRAVQRYPGKLLSVYGEHSQLVRARNVSFSRTAEHLAVSIPGSGMRPHLEQPARVWACVQEHLHLTAQIAS